ncbi:MAG: ROK family transcriptional regulator [Lachnospiraceae bacterium]|nr:ROK family transcriptional regulator [Lachnospiraceae bacterium]
MEKNALHLENIKEQNIRQIRNLLRRQKEMKIADIAKCTGLSYPTTSKLLKELIAQNIVILCEEKTSCGGRPGARYRIHTEYKQALLMYFENEYLKCCVYDYCENEIEIREYQAGRDISVEDVIGIIQDFLESYPSITIIVLGIPGVTLEKEIVCLPYYPLLEGTELAKYCIEELGMDFYVENDTNAIAFAEREGRTSFAHIAYINHCIGVGIIYKGTIMEGARGYAGELEYLCENLQDVRQTLVTCILSLTLVMDLPEILISGDECYCGLEKELINMLSEKIPVDRLPRIQIVENITSYYKKGLKMRITNQWEQE